MNMYGAARYGEPDKWAIFKHEELGCWFATFRRADYSRWGVRCESFKDAVKAVEGRARFHEWASEPLDLGL